MDFKEKVILLFGDRYDFSKRTAIHFNIQPLFVETAVDNIIDNAVNAITIQCSNGKKFNEIYKIAKECASLNFENPISVQEDILYRGRGANSEIFGMNLVFIINEIAAISNLKNSVINKLITLVTPAILSVIYNVSIDNCYTTDQLCDYLQTVHLKNNIAAVTLPATHYDAYDLIGKSA